MAELTRDERLAFFTAFDKKLNDRNNGILTRLKEDARSELIDAFRENGSDRKAILANGEKVGEVGLSYTTAKPYIKADMTEQALDFLEELDMVERVPKKGWEERFTCVDGMVLCKETGEFVDWAIWQPSGVKSASIRGCKPQDVLNALQPKLRYGSEEFYGLLMGGE